MDRITDEEGYLKAMEELKRIYGSGFTAYTEQKEKAREIEAKILIFLQEKETKESNSSNLQKSL